MKYPLRKFIHLDESFSPAKPVADDHPMVALRPDLFAESAKRKPKKPAVVDKPAAPNPVEPAEPVDKSNALDEAESLGDVTTPDPDPLGP